MEAMLQLMMQKFEGVANAVERMDDRIVAIRFVTLSSKQKVSQSVGYPGNVSLGRQPLQMCHLDTGRYKCVTMSINFNS